MSGIKFSANLSLLFANLPFLERPQAAAEAGFDAVEFWWPPAEALDGLVDAIAAAGLSVSLFNFYAGDMPAGDRGLLSDPERVGDFRSNVPVALDLAEELSCSRINALVGTGLPDLAYDEQLQLATESVRWAADQAAERGVTVMIEAVNSIENGPYLLTRTAAAAEFVAAVDRPNVELQFDVYHMQRMEGNLVHGFGEHQDRIGYLQIADSPGRGEPGSGEINFAFVLSEVERLGYDGFVGLEYRPAGGPAATVEGLGWLGDLGYQLKTTGQEAS